MNKKGFTLIELLMALTLVAILAGISFPQYRFMVAKSKRADGIQALRSAHISQMSYFTSLDHFALGHPSVVHLTAFGWDLNSQVTSTGYLFSMYWDPGSINDGYFTFIKNDLDGDGDEDMLGIKYDLVDFSIYPDGIPVVIFNDLN